MILSVFELPSPAPEQSTVKCVGSLAFSPLLSTPGPNTFTMLGWLPLPTFTYGYQQEVTSLIYFNLLKDVRQSNFVAIK